ncbi:phage antirepressor N-terminal domain-containing protein [Coprobacter sp.]|jgi:chromosome segregation ATPase|uniref:phage antirepressor N-terminal domain-containing protein n=1 Tax=Coprobacter sp. TaxID=1941478 RepID=UPI00204A6AA3|nr:chromosome partitioning protein ParA [Tannerella sp.]DAW68832.1 MAG TPA: hypothetical protein [Bacteriophage sp.]
METKTIARVNNVDIISTNDKKLVPIKPICEALGIDPEAQRQKIQAHYLLGPTALLSKVVAADGKERDMYCLPLGYILGWLLTINPANVAESSKDFLIKYQVECYQVLLTHFTERSTFIEEKQKLLIEKTEVLNAAQEAFDMSKEQLKEAKKQYEIIKAIDFEQWKENRQQLQISFE